MDVKDIIRLLKLKPYPGEGGYIFETYKSKEKIPGNALPARYKGKRTFSTAVYYLLTKDSFSAMHKLKSDEVFHFYAGDPAEMLQILPGGRWKKIILGNNIRKGHKIQVVVPRGIWQGTKVKKGGKFALLGTTVAPGFESNDYEHGHREKLIRQYPNLKKEILSLTK